MSGRFMVHFVFILSPITRYKTVVKKLLLIGDKITASWKTSKYMCIIYKLENYKLQITNYKHWKAEFQPSLFSYFAVPAPAPQIVFVFY